MIIKDLANLGQKLLDNKGSLNSLHQAIAENFYPERADFTATRYLGEEFAANLTSSYPVIMRRDLGNQFSTMLRATARPWFHVKRRFSEKEDDTETRQVLEYFETVQRRAMYDPPALFNRTTKAGDHDFATFGQAVISVELNRNGDGLLYRNWHLRDMAWQENAEGQIGFVVRKWNPTLLTLMQTFGKEKMHPDYVKKYEKDPFTKVKVLHLVCEAEMYDEDARGRPRWSVYWDAEHNEVIESTPIWGKHYIIPRWQIIGSQYAYSPAVVAALPDARLIQAMTWTLLEVGEKAANPPLIATKDAVKSDISVFAGGITWADMEYDERLGDVLRPISQDFGGINYGLEMARDTRLMIREAFFLNALTLPERGPEMTAYEVGQRIQEYIRGALPIFEPMETEYNAALCEETFDLMMRNGAFGSPMDWPKSVQGMDIEFHFESPLHDLIDQEKSSKWLEAKTLLAESIALDPSTAFVVDAPTALRDALAGMGVPAKWMNSPDEAQEMLEAYQKQQQQADMLEQLKTGSEAASNLATANSQLQ